MMECKKAIFWQLKVPSNEASYIYWAAPEEGSWYDTFKVDMLQRIFRNSYITVGEIKSHMKTNDSHRKRKLTVVLEQGNFKGNRNPSMENTDGWEAWDDKREARDDR